MSIDLTDQCLRSKYGYGRNLKRLQDQAQELESKGQGTRGSAYISVLFVDVWTGATAVGLEFSIDF
jgi:hypothetical protein